MYKNYLLSIVTGLLLALAWPSYGFPLLLFIAFVPLLIAEKSIRINSKKHNNLHTFFSTYIGFLIWNVITTWWIWNSTHVGAIFAFVVNSLLMTLVFQLYHVLAKRKPRRFSLIFLVAIWIAFEKFHLNWDFSWPWLNLGNAFSEHPQWIQWYEFTGVFGGSLWVWLVNVILFVAIDNYLINKYKKELIKKFVLAISVVVIGVFASLYSYHTYQEKGETLTALLLQPNTDPYTEKYHQSDTKIASDFIDLVKDKMDNEVQYILAPETMFSNHTTIEAFKRGNAYRKIDNFLTDYPETSLLTGISLIKIYKSSTPKSQTANIFSNSNKSWYESFNTALFITKNQVPEIYNKSKLVVGIEHFPFRSVLQPLLGDVMIDLGGSISTLTTQKEPSVFSNSINDFKVAPVICYESIYGEFMGEYVQRGANFFGIITNDSWWGNTQGHRQLLSYARLRAIEHRRAIARSANTGISAFINQKGDVISQLEYETKGVLKGSIQANKKLTFYSKQGDFVARIAALVAIL
ncbi:MAG TPA: apolipoprotein N-acyltransferase, partial [Lutibacter sp.]|nr:apolipoprotein N-acyltransferase [Lutibacter sp.]